MVPTTRNANERLLSLVITTAGRRIQYKQDWPNVSIAILSAIRREFSAELRKTFSRPFAEMEETKFCSQEPRLLGQSGIVISASWSMSDLVPGQHVICLRRSDGEFVAINRNNRTVRIGDKLLARVIGGPDHVSHMEMFLDSCAYAVEDQFLKRHELLQTLQQGCLLPEMLEVFKSSKFEKVSDLMIF